MSCVVSFEAYRRLIENRPFKFDAEQVNYRPSQGKEQCGNCAHFFVRKNDGHTVCEIFRPSDETDESVIANYVCDFWNDDNETYPLLDE